MNRNDRNGEISDRRFETCIAVVPTSNEGSDVVASYVDDTYMAMWLHVATG